MNLIVGSAIQKSVLHANVLHLYHKVWLQSYTLNSYMYIVQFLDIPTVFPIWLIIKL